MRRADGGGRVSSPFCICSTLRGRARGARRGDEGGGEERSAGGRRGPFANALKTLRGGTRRRRESMRPLQPPTATRTRARDRAWAKKPGARRACAPLVPERATVPRFFTRSSRVMPMPRSRMYRILDSGSSQIWEGGEAGVQRDADGGGAWWRVRWGLDSAGGVEQPGSAGSALRAHIVRGGTACTCVRAGVHACPRGCAANQ